MENKEKEWTSWDTLKLFLSAWLILFLVGCFYVFIKGFPPVYYYLWFCVSIILLSLELWFQKRDKREEEIKEGLKKNQSN